MFILVIIVITIAGLIVYASFNPRLCIYSVARAKTNDKVIALTFDDGPSEPVTAQVLNILKQKGVKATFFVVGVNVRRHPEIAGQIVADGHVIANHSDTHSFFMVRRSRSVLVNVQNAQDAIRAATSKRPHFYRPPFGFRTLWGARAIVRDGYCVVTWDDMTFDYWGLSPERIVRNIVRRARPGGIIVLHDGNEAKAAAPRQNVVAALPQIIDKLQEQGYSFVTLDQLLAMPAYS